VRDLDRYPQNEQLRRGLDTATGGFAGGFFGALAGHAEDPAAEIESALDSLDGRFPHARLWLGELLPTYRQSATDLARKEADLDSDR
jgi:hypothetical protein